MYGGVYMKIKKTGNSRIRVSSMGMLYVLTMIYAELFQAGIIGGYYLTAFIIALFWFAMGMVQYISFGDRNNFFHEEKKIIWLVMFPWLVFILYNIFIYTCGIAHASFMKSSFVQITWVPIIIMGAVGSYFIFGKNTIRYFLYSVLVSYIITLIYEFFSLGLLAFISGILTVFTGNSIGNAFETNSDMVLGLGLLGIFYFDTFIKEKKGYRNHGLIIILLILLGGKRIEWLALAGLVLASFVIGFISERKRKILQYLISSIILIGAFVFIYVVFNGFLSTYVYMHGINTMGRIKMWDYISQYANFSWNYLGQGYSFSNLMLEQSRVHTYMGHVYALHSDVLKIFIDLGFLMFLFWNIYYLFVFPNRVRKKYGYKVSNLSWFLVVFLFILYFTDNAINYFITQTIFCYVIFEDVRLINDSYNERY